MDQHIVSLKHDQKDVEDKLDAMKVAGAAHWKSFEGEVSRAVARLRLSVEKASV